jgi:carbohydrate kinase (thermoresistant glucokinase family)
VVLMGVSGVGKTTIGKLLAARTGWKFEDADDDHPGENRRKMAAGIPLTDAAENHGSRLCTSAWCNIAKRTRASFWPARR